jgi:hypothetical protein
MLQRAISEIFATLGYSLEKEFRSRKIPSEIIDEKIFEEMWQGDAFSIYKVPNIDLFCKIGEKLQIDFILTCWLRVADKDQIMKAFLIDVKKHKLIQATEADKIDTAHAWPLHYLNSDFRAGLSVTFI